MANLTLYDVFWTSTDERRAMLCRLDASQHMHYFINIGCLLRKKQASIIGQTKQALTDLLFFKL